MPRLGSDAGERLTVRRAGCHASPQAVTAERTRSRASLTEASGRPTRVKAGSPWLRCASTSHEVALQPDERHRPGASQAHSAHPLEVLDLRGAGGLGTHGDDVDAHPAAADVVLAQPPAGQAAQPGQLDPVDRLGRVTVRGPSGGS